MQYKTFSVSKQQRNNNNNNNNRSQYHLPSLHTGLKRYKILSLVGDGTYGLVYLAINSETREKVSSNLQTKVGYRSENTCFS